MVTQQSGVYVHYTLSSLYQLNLSSVTVIIMLSLCLMLFKLPAQGPQCWADNTGGTFTEILIDKNNEQPETKKWISTV